MVGNWESVYYFLNSLNQIDEMNMHSVNLSFKIIFELYDLKVKILKQYLCLQYFEFEIWIFKVHIYIKKW